MNRTNKVCIFLGFLALAQCSSVKPKETAQAPAPAPVAVSATKESPKLQKPDANRIAQGEGTRLSQAILKNVKREPLSPQREAMLKEIAFAVLHRNGKNILSYGECLTKYNQAEECRFANKDWVQEWVEEWALEEPTTDIVLNKVSRRKRQKNIDRVAKNIKAGIIENIPDQRPGDVYLALKKFSSWTPELENFAQYLLSRPMCEAPEFYSYLGLKAEEYFPNPELLKEAQKIYSKVDLCYKDDKKLSANKQVQNARFRLGLLSVMDKNCKQAQEVFDRLAKQQTTDYISRALYWGAHCARNESHEDLFLNHYGELFRTNPLGFHTLSIAKGDSVLIDNLGKPIDPIIHQRTETQPQFNVWISMLEDLDYLDQFDAVKRMFAPIKFSPEFLNNFEPGVRLYLATFAFRARDRISLFRILDSVFRTQSEYIVDSTMKMFYPTDFFPEILAATQKINPFLIAALIRQESAFAPDARSPVGALGLMQLMPGTARLIDHSVKRGQLLNPETNVRVGTRYFENLVDRFNGDVELALAAYNAGPEAVDSWLRRYPLKNKMLFLDLIPFSETRNYVTLIGRNYYWYTQLYADQVNGVAIDLAQKRQPAVFNALKPEEE